MTDRNKVIKGLECCADLQRKTINRDCDACPYNDDPELGTCFTLFPVIRDALALLKADQAQLVEQRKRLETIADIAIDYDGYRTAEDLMSLIDELRDIALRGVPEEVTDDAD